MRQSTAWLRVTGRSQQQTLEYLVALKRQSEFLKTLGTKDVACQPSDGSGKILLALYFVERGGSRCLALELGQEFRRMLDHSGSPSQRSLGSERITSLRGVIARSPSKLSRRSSRVTGRSFN